MELATMSAAGRVTSLRPVRARVDLDRLAANYHALRALVPVPVMPVVKADAYGHGAVPVARRLVAEGVPRLAVAYVEEAVELREAGIAAPLVVLAPFGPGQEDALLAYGLTPVVSTPRTLDAVLQAAGEAPRPLAVHLKLDTGMRRLGFARDAFVQAAAILAATKGIELEGVMTHLASADEDAAATARQLDLFDEAVETLHARGLRPPFVHACNSAGLAFFRPSHTLVRPGLLLYGIPPRPLSPVVDVQPVMTVSADVVLIKDVPAGAPVAYGGRWVAPRPSRIATLPIGYADGVPRTEGMREHGSFLIGGGRVPVRGTVSMDLTLVDVTDRPEVAEGDEAILVGDVPDAWEVAEWAGTNAWEVVTRIGPRVPRAYVESGRLVSVLSRFVRG
ncbi:MAG TPA: alanine racemase [Vicinamibacteria bacterium]|nr:alanine racemase [Vicinamibacteria bacterium]